MFRVTVNDWIFSSHIFFAIFILMLSFTLGALVIGIQFRKITEQRDADIKSKNEHGFRELSKILKAGNLNYAETISLILNVVAKMLPKENEIEIKNFLLENLASDDKQEILKTLLEKLHEMTQQSITSINCKD